MVQTIPLKLVNIQSKILRFHQIIQFKKLMLSFQSHRQVKKNQPLRQSSHIQNIYRLRVARIMVRPVDNPRRMDGLKILSEEYH